MPMYLLLAAGVIVFTAAQHMLKDRNRLLSVLMAALSIICLVIAVMITVLVPRIG